MGATQLELDRRNDKWQRAAEQSLDYVETMSRRLINLCRAVSQASRKKSAPCWTAQLPWMAAPPPATKEVPAAAVVYHYGYDAFARAPRALDLARRTSAPTRIR